MTEALPKRDDALALLHRYTEKPGLRGHAYAVEIGMRAYARKFGEDEHAWGLVGLLHDFDYERWPDPQDHPYRGVEILEAEGYPEWFRRAVLSHAEYTGVTRETRLEKTLFACDEPSGFLVACAFVTPERKLTQVKLKSVKKKLKSKAFAAGVDRDDVRRGAEDLGIPLDEHLQFLIDALAERADALGLG